VQERDAYILNHQRRITRIHKRNRNCGSGLNPAPEVNIGLRRNKQALARRIGKDTAKLFYEHLVRQPGKPLED